MIVRPTHDADRSFGYKCPPSFHRKKFNRGDPFNMLTEVRLYRWTFSHDYYHEVGSEMLRQFLFADSLDDITTTRMGRVLKGVLMYDPTFQFPANRQTEWRRLRGWRFRNVEDLRFGLAFAICEWLPWWCRATEMDPCDTPERFEEELDTFSCGYPDDELKFVVQATVDSGVPWTNESIFMVEQNQPRYEPKATILHPNPTMNWRKTAVWPTDLNWQTDERGNEYVLESDITNTQKRDLAELGCQRLQMRMTVDGVMKRVTIIKKP